MSDSCGLTGSPTVIVGLCDLLAERESHAPVAQELDAALLLAEGASVGCTTAPDAADRGTLFHH